MITIDGVPTNRIRELISSSSPLVGFNADWMQIRDSIGLINLSVSSLPLPAFRMLNAHCAHNLTHAVVVKRVGKITRLIYSQSVIMLSSSINYCSKWSATDERNFLRLFWLDRCRRRWIGRILRHEKIVTWSLTTYKIEKNFNKILWKITRSIKKYLSCFRHLNPQKLS